MTKPAPRKTLSLPAKKGKKAPPPPPTSPAVKRFIDLGHPPRSKK